MPRPALAVCAFGLALTAASCGGGGGSPGAPATSPPVASTPEQERTTTTHPASPTPPARPCSADELPAELEPQPGLPRAVAETRQALYGAALRCDYGRLDELAPDSGFTYSFGGGQEPVAHWRRAEAAGGERAPMRYLAALLRGPYAETDVQGQRLYSWPAAFAYDEWSQVPRPHREALERVYDEDDVAGFEAFGGYIGYRVLIAEDGTWTAFVAGD